VSDPEALVRFREGVAAPNPEARASARMALEAAISRELGTVPPATGSGKVLLLPNSRMAPCPPSPVAPSPRRRTGVSRRRLAAALATAAAMAAAAIVTSSSAHLGTSDAVPHVTEPAGQASGLGSAPTTIDQATVLTAMQQAAPDVLQIQETTTVTGSASTTEETWTSPAQPQPGQTVQSRILTLQADGTPLRDVGMRYTVPTGPSSYDPLVVGIRTTGEVIDVEYSTSTWSDQRDQTIVQPPGGPVVIAPGAAGSLQQQLQSAEGAELTRQSIQGQPAIEFRWVLSSWTTIDLWVNQRTYLPITEVAYFFVGSPSEQQRGVTEASYSYLPPTAANLAQLMPPIPSGFVQTAAPPAGDSG